MNEGIDFYGSLVRGFNSRRSDSSESKNSSKTRQNESQVFQVYSSFIQQDQNTSTNDSHLKIKKPKLSKNSENTDQEMNIDEDASNNQISNTFVGLNTFECENLFTEFIRDDILIICLEKNSNFKKNNFVFKGRCSLNLIHGSVKINGFKLNDNRSKWFDLFSPETNSYLSIVNDQNQASLDSSKHDFRNILNKCSSHLELNIDNTIEEKIRYFLQKNNFNQATSSLFAIRPLQSQVCNYICYFDNFQKVYQAPFSFCESNVENFDSKQFDHINKFGIYHVKDENFNAINIENENEKNIIEEILSNIDSITTGPVVMPCGGKDVGKSTFLRYLINSLLNKYQTVGYIDCDPGQSEFTLASCVSFNVITDPLFGPPHTHLNHNGPNNKCYFLGHLSPNDIPCVYLHYLKKCYDDFVNFKSRSNQKIPLVINTMGWNQGLGLCLLKESIILFKPSHVIQINHPIEANKNMPTLDFNWLKSSDGWPATKRFDQKLQSEINQMENSYKLISLKSNVPCKNSKFVNNPPQKNISAKDHRNISILAYFSKLNESDVYFKPIHQIRPYKVPWSKLALHVVHSRVDYEQLFRVFNASLVCLSNVDSKFILRRNENQDLPGYLNIYKESIDIVCLGFGIIRGINMDTKEFYILTPEPIEVLNKVNLLCKGMLNLPMEFFCEQDSLTPTPYINLSSQNETKTNLNQISNEPLQRKYLIHQTINNKK